MEIDLAEARRRQYAAAEEAKLLEDRADGFASLAAWERYELITNAIEAQERSARARTMIAGQDTTLDAS
jgi:hypothetical protein